MDCRFLIPRPAERKKHQVPPLRIYINCMCYTSMSGTMVTPTAKNSPPETWGKIRPWVISAWLLLSKIDLGNLQQAYDWKSRSIICRQQRRSSKCFYSTLELIFFQRKSHPPLITVYINLAGEPFSSTTQKWVRTFITMTVYPPPTIPRPRNRAGLCRRFPPGTNLLHKKRLVSVSENWGVPWNWGINGWGGWFGWMDI